MSSRVAANFAGLLIMAMSANAQVLDNIRNDVRKEEKPKCDDQPDDCRNNSSSCNNDSDDFFGGFFYQMLSMPYGVFAEHQARRPTVFFLEYPYQHNHPGYLVEVDPKQRYTEDDTLHPGPWYATLAVEYGYDFHNRIGRTGFNLLVDSTERWGIHTAWNILTERRPNRTDTLTLGNFHLMYRLAEGPGGLIRVGLGANTLIDRFGNNWGMNTHLDTSWFPIKPLVITTAADAGKLGSASVYHFRGTLGVNLQRLELYAGYDWLRIGSTTIHGPTAGLRVWY